MTGLSETVACPLCHQPAVVTSHGLDELATHGIEAEIANLRVALITSRRIGAAVGIVMNAMRMTYDDAFELLSRMSQTDNRKLKDVADDVIYSGLITGSRTTAC